MDRDPYEDFDDTSNEFPKKTIENHKPDKNEEDLNKGSNQQFNNQKKLIRSVSTHKIASSQIQSFEFSKTRSKSNSMISKQRSPTPRKYQDKYIIMDGNNVAIHYGKENFSYKGIKIAIDFLRNKEKEFRLKENGIRLVIRVILPSKRQNPKCNDKKPSIDFDYFQNLKDNNYLIFVPNEQYDDDYILNFATQLKGLILSNDKFKDFQNRKDLEDYYSNYQIKFSFCDDAFYIPERPNGRTAKSLFELLIEENNLKEDYSTYTNSNSDLESEASYSVSRNRSRNTRSKSKKRRESKSFYSLEESKKIILKSNPSLFHLIWKNKQDLEEKFDFKLIQRENFTFEMSATRQLNCNLACERIRLLEKNFVKKEAMFDSNKILVEYLIKRKLEELLAQEGEKEFYIGTFQTEKFFKLYGSSWSNLDSERDKLNSFINSFKIENYKYKFKQSRPKNFDDIIDAIENELIVKIDKSSLSFDQSLIITCLDLNTQAEVIKMLDLNLSDDSTIITPKSHIVLELFRRSDRNKLTAWMKDNSCTYKVEKKTISLSAKATILNKAKEMILNELKKIENDVIKLRYEMPLNLFRLISFSNAEREKLGKKFNVFITIPKNNLEPKLVFEISLNHKSKLRLIVCQGQIEETNCDFLINSVNEKLTHIDGAAKAIANAAGNEYIEECNSLLLNGKITSDRVFATTAGALNASKIINVICSKYYHGSNELVQKYSKCFIECMNLNSKEKCVIGMTLLGTGILNWPLDESFIQFINFLEILPKLNTFTSNTSNIDILLVENNQNFIDHIINLTFINKALFKNLKLIYSIRENDLRVSLNEKNWYWYDDENQWKKFRNEIEIKINEMAKVCNVFQMILDGKIYQFDLVKKIQLNLATKYARPISDEIPFEDSAQWYWYESNMKTAYNLAHNSAIEKAYNQQKSSIELYIKRHIDDVNNIYLIDFQLMIQMNKNTGFKRKIKREIVKKKANVVVENENSENECKKTFDYQDNSIWLSGKKDDIDKLINDLAKIAKEKKITDKIKGFSFKDLNRQLLEENDFKIKKILNNKVVEVTKNGIEITEVNSLELNLTGLLIKDLKMIKEELLTLKISSQNSITNYPTHWSNFTEANLTIIELNLNISDEWNKIETNFKKTLPMNQITKIERIQNKFLFENYDRERKYLSEKRFSKINEVFLWHGTSNTNPERIYNSKHGFDFRYSTSGMWGIGSYFAENASYSKNYAFKTDKSEFKLFFSQVLLGDFVEMQPDQSLKMPPPKLTDPTDSFDSVKGFTNGSNVFIVYEHQKAYPSYLVTFI